MSHESALIRCGMFVCVRSFVRACAAVNEDT